MGRTIVNMSWHCVLAFLVLCVWGGGGGQLDLSYLLYACIYLTRHPCCTCVKTQLAGRAIGLYL